MARGGWPRARQCSEALRLARKRSSAGIPAISCFEVAAAVSRGRIVLDREVDAWLDAALSLPKAELLPLTPRVAVRAATLEGFHGDPADRLIVATAIVEACAIVTRDRRIRRYKGVLSVW